MAKTYSKIDFEQNIARLAMYTSYDKVWNDDFFQNAFVEKYQWNLPLLAYEVFGIEMTFQQIQIWVEFLKTGGFKGGRLAVPSGHSCCPAGETVMMMDGSIRNVEDVKKRDGLRGEDGKHRVVKHLFKGRDNIVAFILRDGTKKRYTMGHKLVLLINRKEVTISVADWICLNYEDKKDSYFKKVVNGKRKSVRIVDYRQDGFEPYYGFSVNKNHRYLDGDGFITHNTGKTKMIGLLSIHHLLCFRKSITRITAPTLGQITSSSFKEMNSSLSGMEDNRRVGDKIYVPKWGFLLSFIQANMETIYVKGFKTEWYIEARTAPKGSPENIAGQHQYSYLLIFDEASGINDDTIAVSLGALSERYNSCIAFSQHTRLNGKFHEWTGVNSIGRGGSWGVLRLSSRLSPRTSISQLKIMLNTYTEDEIRVKVDGLAPKREQGKLFDSEDIDALFDTQNKMFTKNKLFTQLVVSYDVGYTGYRDSSVAVFAEVFAFNDKITEKMKKYIRVVKIAKDGTFKKPVEYTTNVLFPEILTFLDLQAQKGIIYDVIHVLGDASAGGDEAFTKLEDLLMSVGGYDFNCKPIRWGSDKLYFEDKKRFINTRAKAFITLRSSLADDSIVILDKAYRPRIISDLLCLSYSFTDRLLYKIVSKQQLSKEGFQSPDFADALAQVELANFVVSNDEFGEDIDELMGEVVDTEIITEVHSDESGFSSIQMEKDMMELDVLDELDDEDEFGEELDDELDIGFTVE